MPKLMYVGRGDPDEQPFTCNSGLNFPINEAVEVPDIAQYELLKENPHFRTVAANDPKKPYNELPLLPPAHDIESKAVLKACVRANAALSALRVAGKLIPDQTVLINTIPLLEAKGSSEIENIVTTNDALFRQASLADADADPSVKEALRYRAALFNGFESIRHRPITTATAIEICQTLKGVGLDIRATPGTTLTNSHTGEVIYTPPEGADHLRSLLANWERFLNEPTDLDPVVRMALLHYQFEAIHPFVDGNGRTGRVLNILCLVQDKLLDRPTLYLSRHILKTRGDYYRLLSHVTATGDWEPWVLYMLNAVEQTAIWTMHKILSIHKLMDQAAELVRTGAPKIYSRELVELLFIKPYCRIGDVVERGIAKREAASKYLKEIASLGMLIEEKSGRDKVYLHKVYMDLLSSDEHDVKPYPTIAASPAAAKKVSK
jgi:Fic family protein